MRQSIRSLAHQIHSLAPESSILVLCGSGNNGGDGWVAARELLAQGHKVTLVSPRPADQLRAQPAHDAAIEVSHALEQGGAQILIDPDSTQLEDALTHADTIVDCILGTGFSGAEVKQPYAIWIEAVNRHHKASTLVVSADVPSGLSAQTGEAAHTCIQADHTVTMIVSKPGLAQAQAGRVKVAPLAYIEPFFS